MIHHTATRSDLNAWEMEKSMRTHRIDNKGFDIIPTNYIIDREGNIVEVNAPEVMVGACIKDKYNTLDDVVRCNTQGIHIELVGDFSKEEPTQTQYNAVAKTYYRLRNMGYKLEVAYHSDFQSKNCVGELFDKDYMKTLLDKGPLKTKHGPGQQNLIDYAWNISHNKDFILTIERESGFGWDAIGDNNHSYGLCQRYNKDTKYRRVDNDDHTIADGYNMIDECWRVWNIKGDDIADWLHGYPKRFEVEDRFIF